MCWLLFTRRFHIILTCARPGTSIWWSLLNPSLQKQALGNLVGTLFGQNTLRPQVSQQAPQILQMIRLMFRLLEHRLLKVYGCFSACMSCIAALEHASFMPRHSDHLAPEFCWIPLWGIYMLLVSCEEPAGLKLEHNVRMPVCRWFV